MKARYIFILLCLLLSHNIFADSKDDLLFKEANNLYLKQSYFQAIEKYEQLISDNIISFEVYYNLGNAYYKTGNYTKAILNYERAKKIKPDDADVNLNLAIANQKTIDKIEPTPKVFYNQWWDNYLASSTADTSAVIMLVFLWLFIATIAIMIVIKNASLKKLCFIIFLILACFTIFFFITSQTRQSINDSSVEALIISQSAYIKSAPDDKGTNLFQLHEGTKINIVDELGNWKKIKIPNGNVGWVKSKDLETI
ncbi:MAG: tetratricopeptide repeat protein [Bacteroidetes bacterium]|nr:tetratricopeptide repeat protein [Bacteroidota bacterium]